MKILIIGKFQKLEETRQKFQPWADELRNFGHEVINPMEILTGEKDWFDSAGECIKLLLECNSIFLLNDWKNSPIGRLLFSLAMNLHYDIYMEHDMIFLEKLGKTGSEASNMKISPNLIMTWLLKKIKTCQDGVFVAEAMNDLKKGEHYTEELKNYNLVRQIIEQTNDKKTEASHAENNPG